MATTTNSPFGGIHPEAKVYSFLGNRPLALDDSNDVFVVTAGQAEVFSTESANGAPSGRRQHLMTFRQGDVFWGASPTGGKVSLIATGAPGAEALVLDAGQVSNALRKDGAQSEQIEAQVQTSIREIIRTLFPKVSPKQYVEPLAGESCNLQAGAVAQSPHELVFVRTGAGGMHFLSEESLPLTAGEWMPLFAGLWLHASDSGAIEATPLSELLKEHDLPEVLEPFNRFLLAHLHHKRLDRQRDLQERSRLSRESGESAWSAALEDIGEVLDREEAPIHAAPGEDPFLPVMRIIGRRLGLRIIPHPDMVKGREMSDPLGGVAQASRFKTRKVRLEANWQKTDSGEMVGFLKEGRPVALLPLRSGYELVDPQTGGREKVSPAVAQRLEGHAYAVYRPLPERKLTLLDILRFASFRNERDALLIVAVGLAGAVLGLFTPMATKWIFDTIIPSADRYMLLAITLMLFVSATAGSLFNITRGFAMLRTETRMDSGLQAALWDRLLNLPPPFFRRFSVGDLSQRVLGVQQIRRALSGAVLGTVFTSLFSLMQVVMVHKYGGPLAKWALGLVLISLIATVVSSWITIILERQRLAVQGEISSKVFQYLTGINKLKITSSEQKAFINWAHLFARQRSISFRAGTISNYFSVFQTVFPLLCSIVLFYMAFTMISKGGEMSTGQFLAFNASFAILMGSVLSLGQSILSVLSIVPLWERSKPIVETLPEIDEAKSMPPELSGGIEISSVSFRYDPDAPLVLSDVSLDINPGEFVAIIGPSGSGKSSLLRLLLGFETPEAGTIFYDGRDLDSVDIRAVRRQIGTVLQNGRILQGDIYSNIVGAAPVDIETAWAAARQAGLEEDIKNMPMGMHTIVDDGGSTLSGGQRQRLLIARALVQRPRIIFFDEATSALDNRTQAIVSESLRRLNATRVVIAHRLSTIIDADKIVVLKAGRIVEVGRYQELMDLGGDFAEIAARQLA